jgi:hypothetical protein
MSEMIRRGVMVAQRPLEPFVQVRVLAAERWAMQASFPHGGIVVGGPATDTQELPA